MHQAILPSPSKLLSRKSVRRGLAAGTSVAVSGGGRKPVERVRVGDRVLSAGGRPATVLSARAGVCGGEVVTVQLAGAGPLVAAAGQLVAAADGPGDDRWVEVGRLSPGDRLRGSWSGRPVEVLKVSRRAGALPVFAVETDADGGAFAAAGLFVKP